MGPADQKYNPEYETGKESTLVALGIALRDFFMAGNLEEMTAALSLAGLMREAPGANPALEYEFNRLFTGPEAPLAPPWASVYLEKEPRLMGACTIEIRQLAWAAGLEGAAGIPEDWLPLELELYLALLALEETDSLAWLRQGRRWLASHLLSWTPSFIERVRSSTNDSILLEVCIRLENFLDLIRESTWKTAS